ncbi:hypothetical protein V9T40_013094 [Parthenolecanium corni]|uniref:Uncharacterized protein n=1 Tax=Parthenolecanium corni TaxID=536013 RepID=A0AAN9TWM2_9HEMI
MASYTTPTTQNFPTDYLKERYFEKRRFVSYDAAPLGPRRNRVKPAFSPLFLYPSSVLVGVSLESSIVGGGAAYKRVEYAKYGVRRYATHPPRRPSTLLRPRPVLVASRRVGSGFSPAESATAAVFCTTQEESRPGQQSFASAHEPPATASARHQQRNKHAAINRRHHLWLRPGQRIVPRGPAVVPTPTDDRDRDPTLPRTFVVRTRTHIGCAAAIPPNGGDVDVKGGRCGGRRDATQRNATRHNAQIPRPTTNACATRLKRKAEATATATRVTR